MTARVTFGTDSSGTDHPLQANSAAETELTATEIEMLTMDFLFADTEAKATVPKGAQTLSTLRFVKDSATVRDKLWRKSSTICTLLSMVVLSVAVRAGGRVGCACEIRVLRAGSGSRPIPFACVVLVVPSVSHGPERAS